MLYIDTGIDQVKTGCTSAGGVQTRSQQGRGNYHPLHSFQVKNCYRRCARKRHYLKFEIGIIIKMFLMTFLETRSKAEMTIYRLLFGMHYSGYGEQTN